MTLSPKLELLGEISELARDQEGVLAAEANFNLAFADAALDRQWSERRDAVTRLLAAGLNLILTRDRDTRGDGVQEPGDAPWLRRRRR